MSFAFNVDANAAVEPLKVVSQPSSTTIYEGQSKTFVLSATSGSPLNYTWYKDGARLSPTTNTLTITSATAKSAGVFSCRVTDGISTYTCTNFTVTVNNIVRITTQPSNTIVNAGSSASMQVAATGTGPLYYQWYFNGTAITGATQSSVTTSSATLADAGQYYCRVRNGGSSATSNTATLSVMSLSNTYSMSLSWTRPTARTDGKTLTASEISGYNLYYATSSSGTMTRIASVPATQLSYVARNLSAGTHYFAASTVDVNGLESARSARVSRTVQ